MLSAMLRPTAGRYARWAGSIVVLAALATSTEAGDSSFRLPPGFTIDRVAGPPLVHYPLFACLDDRGRLYVAEGTGTNLPGPELVPLKKGRITLLVDEDGDGTYDKSSTFADELVFPQGVL